MGVGVRVYTHYTVGKDVDACICKDHMCSIMNVISLGGLVTLYAMQL